MSTQAPSEWMGKAEVKSVACISDKTIDRLAREGRIGVLQIPGVGKRMFRRADVEALVASGIRPATRGSEAQTESRAMVPA
jgi:hypothetical protein